MIRWLVLAALLLPAIAQAQPSVGPVDARTLGSTPVTATGSTTGQTTADRAAWFQDVRNWFSGTAANCATDVSPAVNAAVTAGIKRIYLPASCIYIPTSQITPAGVTIIGEDWNTSIVSVTTRASQDLKMGARSILQNVGIIGNFCDVTADPINTQKVCPVGEARNNGDSSVTLTNWVYQTLFAMSGPTVTGPTGVVSNDIPQIACETSGNGSDCQYVSTAAANASGLRIVTSAHPGTDNGIYILNGFLDSTTTDSHYGLFAKEFAYSTTGNISTLRLDRVGNGTNVTQSLQVDDVDATQSTDTTPFINLSVSHQSSGQLLNIFGATTPYSGDALLMNMGNASGTFTGNFLNFQIAGTSLFTINSAGRVAEKTVLVGANTGTSVPTGGAVSAIENLKFSSAGDSIVKMMFHMTMATSGSAPVRLTTDGSGTASTTNCGNLTVDNRKAAIRSVTLVATDLTTPANGYQYFNPIAHLARFTGVGTTTLQIGTPVTFSDGTVTGLTVALTADTTNSCPNLSFTPPTGNTDSWRIVASFEMDLVL